MPERNRLPALEVGVAGHQRVRLGLREREGDERERVDLLVRLVACVGDVQSQRRRDLVVAGATRVDLLTERPEEPLDRRMDVLVGLEDRGRVERDLGEAPLHLGELVRVQEPGAVQPAGVLRGRLAVVRQELGVVRAQEIPHGGVQRATDAARPERHGPILRIRRRRRGRSGPGLRCSHARGAAPETRHGLVADVDGWFVVNAREARWRESASFGVWCDFEGKRAFRQLGFNISVLGPGQSMGFYHRENAQEDVLVLAGTCLLIVEDEERTLEAWDFVHCPPETDAHDRRHGRRARGGARRRREGSSTEGHRDVPSKVARQHGVSVEDETTRSAEAYADVPRSARVPYRDGWLPDR